MEHDTQSTPDSMFRLIVLGDGSVRTIPLLGSRWIIGRAPECTVPLRDPTVSRRHIGLERHGECFRFQDLGGSNPILLDGRPVSQGILDVGQTLLIGLTRLTLERRRPSAVIVPDSSATIMLAREVIDEELPAPSAATTFAGIARRVLERIEWTFADLGGLPDVAEPLLDLALNLTGR
ncbi:MAG: FHA domain-containing protein, partial [Planctomycetes bacterium]|nr:FHA domain-containing protein [Planctomycetota bacterium]